MTISQQEIDQMANFMRALNPQPIQDDPPISRPQTKSVAVAESAPATAIDEMKTILERFYKAADNAVVQVNEQASYDRDLREALVTERTDHGLRVGAWEIHIREDGNRKFYGVMHGETCIAADLLLYEAAYGLVRILNEGGMINSKDAVALLRAEQDYAGALNNAVLYKHYMTKNPRDSRMAVFEARYSHSKERAIQARDAVFSIAERL